jgi:hypothetical protein
MSVVLGCGILLEIRGGFQPQSSSDFGYLSKALSTLDRKSGRMMGIPPISLSLPRDLKYHLRPTFVSRRSSVTRGALDRLDGYLLETALEGKADWVVTGDQDLLTLEKFERVRFVTPRIFLQAF